jgi:hypothetical protein
VIGSGPDTVVVRASGDNYQGAPAFKLLIDGVVKAGPVNVTAKHGAGWQDFTFKLDVADAAKKVSVDFFNDFSNGPGQDRNMYVDSISFNGTKLAVDKAALLSNGSSTATLPGTSGPAPTPVPTPIPPQKPPVIGSGPDTVVVRASADSYKGDPSFKLMVDGVAKSGPVNVTTKHGAGWQDFTFKLDVPDAAKKVSVNFFNDFSDGPGQDRNMYVDSISFNGAKLAIDKAALYSNGSSTATLPATPVASPVPAPASPVIGSGPDTVVVRASGDSYQGAPAFKLLVDGVVKAGPVDVTVKHGAGWQDFTFKLDIPDTAKTVAVGFSNDLSDGPGLDRNLYVDSVDVNGHHIVPTAGAMTSNGFLSFGVADFA